MNMKKIMIAASLMFVATAQANETMEIGVDMTPMAKEQQVVVAKSDSRFANYALENIAAGGPGMFGSLSLSGPPMAVNQHAGPKLAT
jgi:hypothetical protein